MIIIINYLWKSSKATLNFFLIADLSQQLPQFIDFLVSRQLTQNNYFIALIHPIQWTIALPVGATGPAKRQKKTSCI